MNVKNVNNDGIIIFKMSEIIQSTRRSFITGLTSLIVAPAIVRVESLMPVKVVEQFTLDDYVRMLHRQCEINLIHEIDISYGHMFVKQQWVDNEFIQTVIPNEEIYVKTN